MTRRESSYKRPQKKQVGVKKEVSKAIELREGLNRYTKLDALIQSRMRSRKGRKIRSQDTIVYEILEACHSPAVEHWIMIKARVGYQSFVKHMGDLLSE